MTPLDWQALLFVPVGAERHLASAIRNRPDAIILDLEDAVAPQSKAAARDVLKAAQAMIHAAGIACVLRVNAGVAAMVADLAAADHDRLDAIIVPKCEGTRLLRNAAELTAQKIPLVALIESPAALNALPALVAMPELSGLMLGSEDYSALLGVDPDMGALETPTIQIANAAAGRGLLSIGFPGSIANFRDLDRYADQIARGRALGMRAVAAIHPAQLPVIRQILAPTQAEVDWATQVVARSAQLKALGQAVGAVDGMMIDAPVIARARRVLAAAKGREANATTTA